MEDIEGEAPPPTLWPQPIAEYLWFRSKGGGREEENGAARGFDPGWLHTLGADATGEFGFFLSHISFCHIWSLRATGSEAPAQMVSSQRAMSYIPAQNKQTIAHWAGQVGGPREGLYIVPVTFLH